MMQVVMVDTREQKNHVTDYFNSHGIPNVRSKLFCGDYTLVNNQSVCIDRKQHLSELCGNVCQGHVRFKAEMERAKAAGIKLIFVVEHGRDIKGLEDVRKWENPRLKESPYALSGEGLYKRLLTIQSRYGVDWVFCHKKQTGAIIAALLGLKEGVSA